MQPVLVLPPLPSWHEHYEEETARASDFFASPECELLERELFFNL
jgi:hypothetical protein